MPPRRPPPLPKSLFTNDGSLAPGEHRIQFLDPTLCFKQLAHPALEPDSHIGTAPIAPAPSSLHPGKIVDASYAPDRSQTFYGNTKVTDVVYVEEQQSSQDGQDQPRVLAGVPIISFDVKASGEDKSNTLDAGHNGPVQINIDQLAPLVSESDWDALEDLVSRLSQVGGSSGKASGETGLESLMNKIGEQVTTLGTNPEAVEQKRIILIGKYRPDVLLQDAFVHFDVSLSIRLLICFYITSHSRSSASRSGSPPPLTTTTIVSTLPILRQPRLVAQSARERSSLVDSTRTLQCTTRECETRRNLVDRCWRA